jgi:cell division protein FtsL
MIPKRGKKVKSIINDWKKKLVIIALGFLVIILLNANIKIIGEVRKGNKELNEVEETIDKLTKEKDKLNFELGKSDSSEYLEKVAREDLGLKKPGEQVIVIKKEEETKKESVEENTRFQFFKNIFNWIKEKLPE